MHLQIFQIQDLDALKKLKILFLKISPFGELINIKQN